ncbi:MAG: glycosyltransferase [Planctomycetia bacterium]|nr:glycosyltransferase [Planctomycetia bacterium]
MSPLLIVWLVLAGGALVQAFLLGLQTYEHRRFARSRRRHAREEPMMNRVLLVAPCKGVEWGLADNLRPLLAQDYPNYEVAFVVESADDPACATIRRLMAAERRVPVKLLVAGKATDTGQKIHNLLAATADLPFNVEIIAFVDSDARPHPGWLRLLVQRLDDPRAAAATGYRWFVPVRPSLAAYIQYSINACAAIIYRRDARGLVWGGSWAIRRDKFEASGLREAWRGTLSDDLMASRVLRAKRMPVTFEPACMLPSPLELDLRQMLEFLRRQYVIGKTYTLRNWCIGFAAIVSSALAFWGSLIAAWYGVATGAAWTWMPVAFCAAWYALNVVRGYLRQSTAREYLPERFPALESACRFDTYASPLVALVNAGVMLAALVGRQITWRGNTYRLYQGGRIRLLSTAGAPPQLPENVRIDPAQPLVDPFRVRPKQTLSKFM